jgi:adenine-specific DNA-methyltransferase
LQKYAKFLHRDKIFIRQSASVLTATIGGHGCCGEYSLFSLISEPAIFDLHFLLGILNSKILTYFALKTEIILCKKGTQPQIRKAGIEALPIPTIPLSHQKEVARVATQILAAKQRNAEADVSALERKIDELVYALYGLTQEEIRTVERELK